MYISDKSEMWGRNNIQPSLGCLAPSFLSDPLWGSQTEENWNERVKFSGTKCTQRISPLDASELIMPVSSLLLPNVYFSTVEADKSKREFLINHVDFIIVNPSEHCQLSVWLGYVSKRIPNSTRNYIPIRVRYLSLWGMRLGYYEGFDWLFAILHKSEYFFN